MVIFPNCKINIGLNIVGKRADGYHNLETVFYPAPIYDILEVLPSTGADEITVTGLPVAGSSSDNLCMKALHLVRAAFPNLPPVNIHLHKAIPMGAGLGGGSSDGAHMLLLLNKKFNLAIPTQMLMDMALELGSDCPFFILNEPCFAWGRGEIMEPLSLSLKGMQLVLINPGIHINTGWAFSQIQPSPPQYSLKQISAWPIQNWHHKVVNDFQNPIAQNHPVIQRILDYCYANGATYAAMTGSGSTCYALFEAESAMPEFHPFADYWIKATTL